TADLAEHEDCIRIRIVVEEPERIDEAGADDGITADSDARRLADSAKRELVDAFVRERAALGDHADTPGLVNVTGHDADFRLARRDDAGTVRAYEPNALSFQRALDPDHVAYGNAFGDADDESNARIGRFEDGIGRARGRHIDHRDVAA